MTKSRQVADFGAGGFTAGKNKIINGAFNIWQRGTSFNAASNAYTADRWDTLTDKTGASVLTTQQAFTAGAAPVAGYEAQYFLRTVFPSGGSYCIQEQRIEDVRTFAGQTVTLSFWAKANSTVSIAPAFVQNFGSGGSADVETTTSSLTLTTSWVRYSVTASIPSISGKTIGTNSYLSARVMRAVTASGFTIDIWGVQLEAGSVATPFTTATGTVQGELTACQRYFFNIGGDSAYATLPTGYSNGSTQLQVPFVFPVEMRTTPTVSKTGNWQSFGPAGSATVSSVTSYLASRKVSGLEVNTSGSITANLVATIRADNDITARINWSAEL